MGSWSGRSGGYWSWCWDCGVWRERRLEQRCINYNQLRAYWMHIDVYAFHNLDDEHYRYVSVDKGIESGRLTFCQPLFFYKLAFFNLSIFRF